MNKIVIAILIIFFPAISFSQAETPSSFGIHLTQLPESVVRDLERNRVDLETVRLNPTPLISEKDIVEYRYPSHVMKLTSECFNRVSYIRVRDVSHGIPFVVVVNGRKAYMGMIWSGASSIPTSYPHITDIEKFLQKDGCTTCVQIRPPNADVRATAYMPLKLLGLIKEDPAPIPDKYLRK